MALSTGKVRTSHHSLAACKRPKYITDVTRCENMDEKRFSFQIQRSVKTKKNNFGHKQNLRFDLIDPYRRMGTRKSALHLSE